MDRTWMDYHIISQRPNNHHGKLLAKGCRNISQLQKQGMSLNLKWQPGIFDPSSSNLDSITATNPLEEPVSDRSTTEHSRYQLECTQTLKLLLSYHCTITG